MSDANTDGMERARARYFAATPKSRALAERARDCLPDGVSRTGLVYSHYPPFIERAEGQFLYDVDGNAILDMANGFSSLPLGHAHPAVVEAVQAQLAKGMGHGLMSAGEVELASMLRERIPSLERVRFTASGTEATMFAVRLARAFTGRTTFARMEGSYHGLHDMMSSGMGANIGQPWPGMEGDPVGNGVPPRVRDEVAFMPFNDLEGCADVITEHADDLAAVIVEPFMGAGGGIPSEPGFLAGLRELCDRHGVLLIFDEMISIGMSRGGAQGFYDVAPDLTACGKLVGGGMPMGVFGGRADIMALCAGEGGTPPVLHTGTWNAHPVAMAAGLAQLGQLTPAAYDHLDEIGEYMRGRVRELAASRGVALHVTGVRHFSAFHYTAEPVRDHRDARKGDAALAWRVGFSLLSQGFHVPGGIRTNLSTAIEKADIDRFVTALDTAFDEGGATA